MIEKLGDNIMLTLSYETVALYKLNENFERHVFLSASVDYLSELYKHGGNEFSSYVHEYVVALSEIDKNELYTDWFFAVMRFFNRLHV